MEFLLLLSLASIVSVTTSITISPNGNSPERVMVSGMMVDAQKVIDPILDDKLKDKTNYEKSRKVNLNMTNLSQNERYRRLIPYMTFYYANGVASPKTELYKTDNVEVQKVHIEENNVPLRDGKKIYPPNRQVSRYHGSRLPQQNFPSTNPTNAFKAAVYSGYRIPYKTTQNNHNPLYLEQSFMNGHTFGRNTLKQKPIDYSFIESQTRPYATRQKPYHDLFHVDDPAQIKYYVPEDKPALKYKLIPYEQTPPVQVIPQNQQQNYYERPKSSIPVPVLSSNVYKTKPRPQSYLSYEDVIVQPPSNRDHVNPITEMFYEITSKPASYDYSSKPPTPEGGFVPIVPMNALNAQTVSFAHSTTIAPPLRVMQGANIHKIQAAPIEPEYAHDYAHPGYYDYVPQSPSPVQYEEPKYSYRDSATLSDILQTLQKSHSIPQPITKENVGSSIRTLLQVLNALKAMAPQHNEVESPILSTPKPFAATPKILSVESGNPELQVQPSVDPSSLEGEEYLAPVNVPSQHLEDYRGSSQSFPLVIASEDDGGTPGRAGIDYPILTTIPTTAFDCKTQRYKGFFADPDTKCQVWHYCDLNGGQASFLCPNGTIFSQQALTCDWWFNVKCSSTHQLYVLNERLYKYILPHSPKFPEDYSGPLVDKYLTIKFKEMEEQFKKNKKKQSGGTSEVDKMGEAEADDDNESEDDVSQGATRIVAEEEGSTEGHSGGGLGLLSVSEPSVVVESPGNSGNVQHLEP